MRPIKNKKTSTFLKYTFNKFNFFQKNHQNKNDTISIRSKNRLRENPNSKLEKKSFILWTK
jgi:hypothetical protein